MKMIGDGFGMIENSVVGRLFISEWAKLFRRGIVLKSGCDRKCVVGCPYILRLGGWRV